MVHTVGVFKPSPLVHPPRPWQPQDDPWLLTLILWAPGRYQCIWHKPFQGVSIVEGINSHPIWVYLRPSGFGPAPFPGSFPAAGFQSWCWGFLCFCTNPPPPTPSSWPPKALLQAALFPRAVLAAPPPLGSHRTCDQLSYATRPCHQIAKKVWLYPHFP